MAAEDAQKRECDARCGTEMRQEGSRTFQNGLSDPDFRCRPRQICERRGKDIKVEHAILRFSTSSGLRPIRVATGAGEPVEEDRSGWEIVQEELQPGSFSPPCWAGVIPQDPTREQDLTPDCPWPRNPSPGAARIWQGPSAFFLFCPPFWHFFYIVRAIRPEVTSPETTRQLALGGFLSLFIIFFFYTGANSHLLSLILRKGRGEEGLRGLSEDTDGVIDQRRKRDSEDLPPAHSSRNSPIGFQASDPINSRLTLAGQCPQKVIDLKRATKEVLPYLRTSKKQENWRRTDDKSPSRIEVRIGQRTFQAILDSGATFNFVSGSLFQPDSYSRQLLDLASQRTTIETSGFFVNSLHVGEHTYGMATMDFTLGCVHHGVTDRSTSYWNRECPWSDNTDVPEIAKLNHGFPSSYAHNFRNIVREFASVFREQSATATVRVVTHTIRLNKDEPFRIRPYHLSESEDKKRALYECVNEMLAAGVIERSDSEYCSPVVLVKKKDGTVRFCTDYRRLNRLTKDQAAPLPRIQEVLRDFGTATVYSSLDLKSGYWQIPMDQASKRLTAFATPDGATYQYRVMPFVAGATVGDSVVYASQGKVHGGPGVPQPLKSEDDVVTEFIHD
ncbi:hypothetical protein GEV33_007018 [Tenebrio molitor]|uniref:Reverse transcriptase domain-containing protein n=1 Tax=Tenebrio molitor TaxID=7067 RepID=A0A8J6HK38_TENMO|nr:hypothetical protein GEV33_007018 [Tenebrio molitor]